MRGHLHAVLLLAATTGIGVLAGLFAPEGVHGFHLYPFGMLPLVVLQLGPGRRGPISVLVGATTLLTLTALGTPPYAALLYAVAGVGCAHLCLRILRSDSPTSPPPGRGWTLLVTATTAAAVVLALAALLATAGEPLDVRGAVVAASFVNAFGTFIAWLPLTRRQRSLPALCGPVERAAQWIALPAAALLAFSSSATSSFSYVVLALLSWAALRLTWHEVLAQVLLVRFAAITLTNHERGPWAGVTTDLHAADLVPDLAPLDAQIFLITCSLCVVALSLSSARTRAEIQRSAREDAEHVAEERLVNVVEELEAERTALKQMQEVDRLKDSLISTVSHELRTPITNIIGYTELLEEGDYGDLSAPQRQALTRVDTNSRRLLAMIDDLLTVSRLRSAAVSLERRPIDLVRVVRAAEETIAPRVHDAGVSLEMDLPAAPLLTSGDATKLERVLVNLLSNAVKFTPPLGQVTVRLRAQGGWAVVEVADTGYGIPPEDLERLFSQFFRSSVAEERHIQGTGLGLAIVRSIVEAHGGQVDVVSTVDVGTTFSVRLPLAPVPAGPGSAGTGSARQDSAAPESAAPESGPP